MPRSGTTLIFSTVANHSELAWFSQYLARFPSVPAVAVLSRLIDLEAGFRKSVARHSEKRSLIERARITPSEAYEVWARCCGDKFAADYLMGAAATESERRCVVKAVSQVMRYQGKPRFAAKVTGPGRIAYLTSIFEDARFIHVIRDGRAVVESLMRVPFWKDTYRLHEPAWSGGPDDGRLERLRREDPSPQALAAVQWQTVIESIRAEAAGLPPGRYAEIRYEDFVRDPHPLLDQIVNFCDLPPDPRPRAFLDDRLVLRDMNYRWSERLTPPEVERLNDLLEEPLRDLGYSSAADSIGPSRGLRQLD